MPAGYFLVEIQSVRPHAALVFVVSGGLPQTINCRGRNLTYFRVFVYVGPFLDGLAWCPPGPLKASWGVIRDDLGIAPRVVGQLSLGISLEAQEKSEDVIGMFSGCAPVWVWWGGSRDLRGARGARRRPWAGGVRRKSRMFSAGGGVSIDIFSGPPAVDPRRGEGTIDADLAGHLPQRAAAELGGRVGACTVALVVRRDHALGLGPASLSRA